MSIRFVHMTEENLKTQYKGFLEDEVLNTQSAILTKCLLRGKQKLMDTPGNPYRLQKLIAKYDSTLKSDKTKTAPWGLPLLESLLDEM